MGSHRASDGRGTVADVVRDAIAGSVRRLHEHEHGVRRGGDPEDVHQARVAVRRLRSDLRTFEAFLDPAWTAPLRSELRWLAGELGPVRDAEVLHARLCDHAKLLPEGHREEAEAVVHRLVSERDAARAHLVGAMGSARYARLVAGLDDAARRPRFTARAADPARRALPSVVRRPWRRLRDDVAALGPAPTDEALHEVRIRAKRARYAAEAAAAALGARTRRFARALAALQDVLGEHQDAVVAGRWLASAAAGSPPAQAFAAGMLAEVEAQAARAARAAFPAAWRDVRRHRPASW
ncbi:MAG: CHAD domain-containing protein [Acidimicrobiia bacterium]|nr:MAG: CHAD domain-containing protein [Acidimicrobiia bacterium]